MQRFKFIQQIENCMQRKLVNVIVTINICIVSQMGCSAGTIKLHNELSTLSIGTVTSDYNKAAEIIIRSKFGTDVEINYVTVWLADGVNTKGGYEATFLSSGTYNNMLGKFNIEIVPGVRKFLVASGISPNYNPSANVQFLVEPNHRYYLGQISKSKNGSRRSINSMFIYSWLPVVVDMTKNKFVELDISKPISHK